MKKINIVVVVFILIFFLFNVVECSIRITWKHMTDSVKRRQQQTLSDLKNKRKKAEVRKRISFYK